MKVGRAFGVALGCVALLGGCVKDTGVVAVRGNFSALFACEEENVHVVKANDGYDATGCDHLLHYVCNGQDCVPAKPPSLPPPPDPGERVTELKLTMGLDYGVILTLTATPAEQEDAELTAQGYFQKDCELGLMIDGERRDLDATQSTLKLPKDVMRDLGSARQVGVRLCSRRWSLEASQILQIRRFAGRYFEELGWETTSSNAEGHERAAPRGGWQPWHALKDFPQAASTPLTAAALFERVSPSIARVECAISQEKTAQGSAVAITPTSLLTNCHVVSGARSIKVSQDKSEWPARLVTSDVAKDRCVLEVADAHFKPIQGVRPYVDLKVGEQLYTLGNPSGLDLTLTDGILSALREDSGVRYVQTTAPISPGSSGGGLFDARGNLVGITTLSFVGREHLNQSLNFAIAAEMFWSP